MLPALCHDNGVSAASAVAMSYTFDTSEPDNDGILIVKIGGERPYLDVENVEELLTFWSRMPDELRAKSSRRILALSSARGKVSSTAVLAFYQGLSELGFEPGVRLAVTVPDDADRVFSVIQLGISVAANNGWNIGLFASERGARQWLCLR